MIENIQEVVTSNDLDSRLSELSGDGYKIITALRQWQGTTEGYRIFAVKDTTEQAAFEKIANGVLNVSI